MESKGCHVRLSVPSRMGISKQAGEGNLTSGTLWYGRWAPASITILTQWRPWFNFQQGAPQGCPEPKTAQCLHRWYEWGTKEGAYKTCMWQRSWRTGLEFRMSFQIGTKFWNKYHATWQVSVIFFLASLSHQPPATQHVARPPGTGAYSRSSF